MITPFEFVLLFLASFRLTHLFVFDQITYFIRKPFLMIADHQQPDGTIVQYVTPRGKGIRKFIGELLSCHWCFGIWCATFLLLGFLFLPIIFYPLAIILAIAGCAAMIETIVSYISH